MAEFVDKSAPRQPYLRLAQQKSTQVLKDQRQNQPAIASQLQVKAMPAPASLAAQSSASSLPRQLKQGLEHLSGLPMDKVKVHYNSAKPAQLQAHAYAEAEQIHLAPGQSQHLPHEAWHLVQQKQGRVKPTTQRQGVTLNDDRKLEREADLMGAKALAGSVSALQKSAALTSDSGQPPVQTIANTAAAPMQLQQAPGWYRINKAANFRNNDAGYTVRAKLPVGTIVEVIDKGYKVSRFKAGWSENEHSWSEIPIHNLQGWVEDSKLSAGAKNGVTPHDEIAPRILAHRAHHYQGTGAHYHSKVREGVSFNILKQGRRFEISNATPGLSGYLEYAQVGKTIDLRHFEAQPEGLGLGSVLMYEFAIFAESLGIHSVAVQTSALSAMGAYQAFGGKPLPGKEGAFMRLQQRYQTDMGLHQDALKGEHVRPDHRDSSYDNFIDEEAKALGKSAANRAAFDEPSLPGDTLDEINHKTASAHRDKHPRNLANLKRVAYLRALSGFLSYDIAELKQRSAGMLAKKWYMP